MLKRIGLTLLIFGFISKALAIHDQDAPIKQDSPRKEKCKTCQKYSILSLLTVVVNKILFKKSFLDLHFLINSVSVAMKLGI